MKKMLRLVLGVLTMFALGATSLNGAMAAAQGGSASAGTNHPDDGGAGDYGVMN
ncbi:hypothetical protein DEIPH_ctg060orf0008 [Deinococcus phoenicis]|uniref:Uncharacterized protein n=1 Tax=Deinococcus phoenicis TaxID=1476583 RepID=A0A016QMD1_9DEIO|nr:hypothetical protein [Deinococcus phoenicis]EYB66934.1 hypothetical protein DEIPH_ctg060orf0008 [Deinococcus phoenicis]